MHVFKGRKESSATSSQSYIYIMLRCLQHTCSTHIELVQLKGLTEAKSGILTQKRDSSSLDIDLSWPSSSESFICTSYQRLDPGQQWNSSLSILPSSHSHVPSNDPREFKSSRDSSRHPKRPDR